MKFQDKLIKKIKQKNTVLVVGLDPNLELFPEVILKDFQDKSIIEVIYKFNQMIIDLVHDKCIAVKPHLAYYEVFGSEGIKGLEKNQICS